MSYNSIIFVHCGKHIDSLYQTRLIHNGDEIWKDSSTGVLQLLCFKQIINPITFIPEICIIKDESFSLDFEGLKKLQRKVKSCPGESFLLLSFTNLNPKEIPNNFIFYLKNKLMAALLETSCSCSSNWCLLLQKLKNSTDRTPNEGFQCPRNIVSSSVFKNHQCWNSLHQEQEKIKPPPIQWDFDFKNNGTWLYLGESFSMEQAQIKLDLKKLPYILQDTQLKIK